MLLVLTLVVFHIKVAGEDAFLQLIYDNLEMKWVLNGNKLKPGRPGISYGSPTKDDIKDDPQISNIEYLEQYNGLAGMLGQIKSGFALPKSIQSQMFDGVFFNP